MVIGVKNGKRSKKQHLDALVPRQVFFPQVWPDPAPKAVAASCSADSLVPLILSEAELDGIATVAGNGSKV